jgi:hypothetical protein
MHWCLHDIAGAPRYRLVGMSLESLLAWLCPLHYSWPREMRTSGPVRVPRFGECIKTLKISKP